ncbi:MAG: hypothetical protein ACRD4T_05565 [Candidatus Acidiferrales bacterium]
MQAAFYIELDEGDDRLEIPWADPNNPANCFYDLKAEPRQLERISEARNNAPLRRFLAALSAPDTLFATAKCDTWQTDEFSDDERAAFPQAQAKFASYVDLVFSRDEFNFNREYYEQLAQRLLPILTAAPVAARAELCLRRCYFGAHKDWGFYLTVFLYGYGCDATEAEKEWAAGLPALESALLRLSAALQQALRQAGS